MLGCIILQRYIWWILWQLWVGFSNHSNSRSMIWNEYCGTSLQGNLWWWGRHTFEENVWWCYKYLQWICRGCQQFWIIMLFKQGDGSSSMGRPNAFPQNPTDVASPKSELNHYLTDSKVHPHEEFDVLEWWRYNSLTYPTLARIVHDFLSIPIFTCYTSFCSSLWDDIDGIYITGLDVWLKMCLGLYKSLVEWLWKYIMKCCWKFIL